MPEGSSEKDHKKLQVNDSSLQVARIV
jgi:hypothetical protein